MTVNVDANGVVIISPPETGAKIISVIHNSWNYLVVLGRNDDNNWPLRFFNIAATYPTRLGATSNVSIKVYYYIG